MANAETAAPLPAGVDGAPPEDYPRLLKRMERLMEIGQSLASILDLSRLLRKIVEAARELTSSEESSIMLIDPRTGELRFEATSNPATGAFEGIALPMEGSIAGWVATHSEPLLVVDAPADPRWNPSVDQMTSFVTKSLLAAPLSTQGQTIGAIEVVNKLDGEYGQDDLATLKWLAAQAAVAIANARLFIQSDLVAELVHEVRTPLTALMATSQLLLRPELTDEQRRDLVDTLQRETSRLSEMATGFLDMAKLESGRAVFSVRPVDMAKLISETVAVVQQQAAERGLAVVCDVQAGLPMIETDHDRVTQVLLNLLTNAVKYNRPGGEVQVRAEAAPGGVNVSVADNGFGIPAAALPRVFERFYRVPDSEGYAVGTGLGLPIAKRIVEALGGEIGVETLANVGTRFFFSLPLEIKKTGPLAGK